MIEVEVQNETYQTQQVVRFAAVPRIGEGIHLLDESGFSSCFDVVDVWYQKASYGDVWIPFIHVRKTPAATDTQLNHDGKSTTQAGPARSAQTAELAARFS